MAMNKKAMFFTLTAILLLSILIFYPTSYQYKYFTKRTMAAEQRIYAINNYVKNLERDTKRGVYISSFRALYALNDYITSSGEFLNDTKSSFYTAIINGTIHNESYVVLQNSTLTDWISKIEFEGTKLHINTEIWVNNITLYQEHPWFVTIGANLSLVVYDDAQTATWNRNTLFKVNVSILGFEDPLYIYHGLGRLTSIINKSPYDENFIIGTNTTNLMDHVENSYYVNSTLAPSFLMRLEGNLSNSPYGIESMVYLPKFTAQGIPVYARSSIDSVYWSSDNPTIYKINNTPSWFYVDDNHLDRYGLTSLTLP